jgi:hypothetical protein
MTNSTQNSHLIGFEVLTRTTPVTKATTTKVGID